MRASPLRMSWVILVAVIGGVSAGAVAGPPKGGHYAGGHYAGGHYAGGHYAGGHYAGGHYAGGHYAGGHYAARGQSGASAPCELPEATVVRREGNAVLESWEVPAIPVWFGDNLPGSREYEAYRAAIRAAGADQVQPPADLPQPKDDAERELWRRERLNVSQMYSGGGHVRRVHCLEAALFARQHARYSQLTQPTEFIAHVLQRGDRLRIYAGSSDQEFPPKSFYGTDEARRDVRAGWVYAAVLHNHTIRTQNGKLTLGVPAPSTSDVELFLGLVAQLALREVWITNGMYTGVVAAESLSRFSTR